MIEHIELTLKKCLDIGLSTITSPISLCLSTCGIESMSEGTLADDPCHCPRDPRLAAFLTTVKGGLRPPKPPKGSVGAPGTLLGMMTALIGSWVGRREM